MIKIDDIPDSWTKDQEKIYRLYSEYLTDSKNNIEPEAIEEFEKLITKWLDESRIKIVSWNCNGKFREKFEEIVEEDADIYVIQECEYFCGFYNDNRYIFKHSQNVILKRFYYEGFEQGITDREK